LSELPDLKERSHDKRLFVTCAQVVRAHIHGATTRPLFASPAGDGPATPPPSLFPHRRLFHLITAMGIFSKVTSDAVDEIAIPTVSC